MIEWRNVFSSHINEIGYDREKKELIVKWDSGKVSAYAGVPEQLAVEVANSPSVGSAIATQIKGHYPHRYV